jgi:hypothetical protein
MINRRSYRTRVQRVVVRRSSKWEKNAKTNSQSRKRRVHAQLSETASRESYERKTVFPAMPSLRLVKLRFMGTAKIVPPTDYRSA